MGGAMASTVMADVQDAVFPATSVAVYVTVVVPIGKSLCVGPDTWA
jgi:hypothetical protein